ncbi:MAG: T9SS type A sorting domain-containing protein [Candidatus Cloacimonetes bacterium]|nr:T9SS type A sorting domain-containing protein [Candidatus Cloacimonadota bacterium]MBL7087012.1 T9SS type A sorting domain-containing protein [Candidatus Cloacimonadota bacterium]
MNNSSPSLSNVTISENSAVYGGGGLYLCNSIPVFDSTNRCNIFLNTTQSENAHDLYAVECPIIDVILDTFTVLYPTNYFAYPIDVFTFDILNAKIEQVNQDLYVSPAGSNNNSGLTPDEPLLTISFALIKILADSTNPHTIHLANGTYSPSQTGEIFPLYSKNYVTLKGEDECITILDAEGLTNVLHCFSNMKFFIEELTITNGNALMGGGIYCCYHSTLYIKNVKIIGNTANHSGGGMYCEYDTEVYLNNVTVSQNIISDNYGYGGGVSCYKEVKFHFTNGVVQHNTARYGGGISLNCSSSRLANVIVANNSANKGGGIYSYYSDLNLFNVTSYGNTASESGGSIYGGTPNTVLVNCIFWNDTPQEIDTTYSSVFVSYSDIQGGWDGEGNIDADPLFADTTNNDFHLTEGSPCIDAGIPDTTGLNLPSWDLDGNYRVWDGNGDGIAIIDMGCYEFDAPPYVGIDDEPESPILFKLYQNYPNPFNFSTTISFSVYSRDAQNAEIRIYNIKGQIVRQLSIVNSQLNWEQSSIEWDGKDERGKLVSSGIYFYQFKVGDKVIDTKKCLLLR